MTQIQAAHSLNFEFHSSDQPAIVIEPNHCDARFGLPNPDLLLMPFKSPDSALFSPASDLMQAT